MFDTSSDPLLQRTAGRASVGLALRGGKTRLTDLHQSGSAKAMLPKISSPTPEVVFLNTAGGITGGDQLNYSVSVAPGAAGIATTQTAERAYRSNSGTGHLVTSIDVGAGATLDWLPQETILFENSDLTRNLCVNLAPDARFLFVETLVLGREAMGEDPRGLFLRDTRKIFRDGCLIFSEPLMLTPETLSSPSAALLGGARAIATIGLFAPAAEDLLPAIRSVAPQENVTCAASAWDSKLIVRMASKNAFALRRAVAGVLAQIRRCPAPRVWQI